MTGRPPFASSRWLQAQIAADPGLVDYADPRTVVCRSGQHGILIVLRRAIHDLYPEWLRRVEAEAGHAQVDGPRGFRMAVTKCVKRLQKNGDGCNGSNGANGQ